MSGYVLEPSPFRNIPATFWLITITATTVGYGDLFPTSSMGKLVGSGCALTGVLALALPITIVGANFANEYSKNEKNKVSGFGEYQRWYLYILKFTKYVYTIYRCDDFRRLPSLCFHFSRRVVIQ